MLAYFVAPEKGWMLRCAKRRLWMSWTCAKKTRWNHVNWIGLKCLHSIGLNGFKCVLHCNVHFCCFLSQHSKWKCIDSDRSLWFPFQEDFERRKQQEAERCMADIASVAMDPWDVDQSIRPGPSTQNFPNIWDLLFWPTYSALSRVEGYRNLDWPISSEDDYHKIELGHLERTANLED